MPKSLDSQPNSFDKDALRRILVLRDFCIRLHGSSCERCCAGCPHDAITFSDDGLPLISNDFCTHCDICLGLCDAFVEGCTTITDLYTRIRQIALTEESIVVTCEDQARNKNLTDNTVIVPCLAIFPPELWSVLIAEDIPFKVAYSETLCDTCNRTACTGRSLFTYSISVAEKWTDCQIETLDDIPIQKPAETPTDRRDAFTNTISALSDIASGKYRLKTSKNLQQSREQRERTRIQVQLNLDEEPILNDFAVGGLTRKALHPRRLFLLEALQRKPAIAQRIVLPIAHTSKETCTNCLACTKTCPTSARFPNPENGTLSFDSRYCIGCGLCTSSCPRKSICIQSIHAKNLSEENL